VERLGFESPFPSRDRLGAIQHPIRWVPGTAAIGCSCRDVELITHIHIVREGFKEVELRPPLPTYGRGLVVRKTQGQIHEFLSCASHPYLHDFCHLLGLNKPSLDPLGVDKRTYVTTTIANMIITNSKQIGCF
jgi:hypothetical protein